MSNEMWSALTIPTFLFLNFFFSVGLAHNSGLATDINDSYPLFWDKISGEIAEFPVQGNKTIIDTWTYIDRLRMYKILLKETSKYFAQFGPDNSGNVLWALALFYGKLYKTERFADPSNITVCAYDAVSPGCLSINSGWSGISFYVTVITFLAAIESGFLRNISREVVLLSREEHRSNFCYSIEECRALHPQAMDTANRFYQYLQSRKLLSTISKIPVYDTDQDMAIHLMWETHQAAIDVGIPKFSDISQHFSATERDFALDFLTAIEFFEAARYRSYFKSSEEFLVGYPHRLLTDQESPILANDLSTREKALLTSVALISKVNKITGGWFLTVWKMFISVSRWRRALGRFLIKRLLLRNS